MTRFALVLLALSSTFSFAFADTHLARRDHGRLLARGKEGGVDWRATKRETDNTRFTFYNVQTGNQYVS